LPREAFSLAEPLVITRFEMPYECPACPQAATSRERAELMMHNQDLDVAMFNNGAYM
jgi:hypothetical protein